MRLLDATRWPLGGALYHGQPRGREVNSRGAELLLTICDRLGRCDHAIIVGIKICQCRAGRRQRLKCDDGVNAVHTRSPTVGAPSPETSSGV